MQVEIYNGGYIGRDDCRLPKKVTTIEAATVKDGISEFIKNNRVPELGGIDGMYSTQCFSLNGTLYYTNERLAMDNFRETLARMIEIKELDIKLTGNPSAPITLEFK